MILNVLMNWDISNKEMLKAQKLELLIYLINIMNNRYKLLIIKTFKFIIYPKKSLGFKGNIQELNYSIKIVHEMNKLSLLFFLKKTAQNLYFDCHYKTFL